MFENEYVVHYNFLFTIIYPPNRCISYLRACASVCASLPDVLPIYCVQVLERGYNIQDEVFLHREQRGKLAGVEAIASKNARQWAGAGLEGKIVRRWGVVLNVLLYCMC